MRGNSLTPKQISRWNRKSPVKSVTQIEASRNKIRIIKILLETLDYYSNFDPLLNCHRSSRPEKLAIFAQRNGRWKEEITSLPRPWKSSVSTLNRRPSFEIRHVRDNPGRTFFHTWDAIENTNTVSRTERHTLTMDCADGARAKLHILLNLRERPAIAAPPQLRRSLKV